MDTPRTPVHILTGFLGSGKTTLLNRLLSERAFQNTAVIVNELGDIGLDHLLVSERADDIALLEGGCLCCAVVDSLPETLLELCQKRAGGDLPQFERIIIETTGFADPGPILDVLRYSPLLSHFLQPGLVLTTIDATAAPEQVALYPEARAQIVLADRLIPTKLDIFPATDMSWAQALNPLAEVLPATEIQADPARLLAAPISPRPQFSEPDAVPAQAEGSHGHAPHEACTSLCAPTQHSHQVRAWSFAIDTPATRSGLAAFAAALKHRFGTRVLRCKGLLRIGTKDILIQGVGTRYQFGDAPASTRDTPYHLTVIVDGPARAEIAALLHWLHVFEGSMPPTKEELA